MQQVKFEIISNLPLTTDIFRMWLRAGSQEALTALQACKAGQFINLAVEGCFLRRPISICDIDSDRLCIVYKTIGKGTTILSQMQPAQQIDVLLPLGNGFCIEAAGDQPVLVGGGVGVPPMLLLAKQLIKRCKQVDVVLGFNTDRDIILADDFGSLGCNVVIATADGSAGHKGFVTDALRTINANQQNTYFYSCGPKPMLRALQEQLTIDGQMSMEERMGCGFGACMGCTCKTTKGTKQVCTDGPVFLKEELIF